MLYVLMKLGSKVEAIVKSWATVSWVTYDVGKFYTVMLCAYPQSGVAVNSYGPMTR